MNVDPSYKLKTERRLLRHVAEECIAHVFSASRHDEFKEGTVEDTLSNSGELLKPNSVIPWMMTIALSILVAISIPFQQQIASNVPVYTACIYYGVLLSPSCLFGIWLGTMTTRWRFLFLIPLSILGALNTAFIEGPFVPTEFLMPFVTTLLLFILFELTKNIFRVKVASTGPPLTKSVPQFGISGLIVTTTAVAVVAGLFGNLDRLLSDIGWRQTIRDLFIFAGLFAHSAVLNTWLLFAANRWTIGLTTIPASVAGFALVMWLLDCGQDECFYYGVSFFTCWGITLTQLFILRRFGYRFVSMKAQAFS